MASSRCMVRPYPCLRASKRSSASRTTTSNPFLCSATAAAAPPMPPPATTMHPHLDTSTGANGLDNCASLRFLRCRRRLTIPCCPAFPNAHAVLSSSSSLKSSMHRSADCANAVNNCASNWPAFANAHAVLASPCTVKLPKCHSTTPANAAKSCASEWPAVANAQTVLASSWALKSLARFSATLAIAANNCASYWPAFANAHAVLASSCALQSPTRHSIDLANAFIKAPIDRPLPLLATPCAMLASCRARTSGPETVRIVCCTNDSSALAFSLNQYWPEVFAMWPSEFQQADKWM
mmetsp:Transcript_74916/g.168069  ORF Transcript_74916/g.168069 Transcript_74916/m.168069 type:complete len:295 (-) Transcript_74916:173-1057(-)